MGKSVILGPDGRPFDRSSLEEEHGGPTLTGVRSILSDHPAAGLTPARLAALLRDSEQGDATAYLELAEDMEERDLHYGGVLRTRKLSVSQLPVTVEAAGTDAAAIKAADLVRAWLNAFDVEDMGFDLCDGLGKGFGAVELMWELSGGEWRPAEALYRQPSWFQFDRLNGRTLRLRDGSAGGADLAAYKWLVHRPRTKSGLPIRGGLARAAAWAFLFKSYGVKDWVIFAETYGHPLRLGKYGPEASAADRSVLLRAVRDIGSDAAAIIPKSMDVEFVKAEGSQTSASVYEDLCEFWDRQVSKAVLGQTATTDAIAGGHAVGQEHRLVQEDIERADARQLAATLNRQLVPALVSFNLGPQSAYPKIVIGRPDEADTDKLVKWVQALVPLGLKVSMAEVRDKIGLADPDDGEELLTAGGPAAAASPAPQPAAQPGSTKATAAAGAVEGGDDVDGLVDAMLNDWRPVMDDMLRPVLAAVDAAKTPADLEKALAELAAADPKALADMLARGGFVARLAGLTQGRGA